jgi:hypothetical protein
MRNFEKSTVFVFFSKSLGQEFEIKKGLARRIRQDPGN